ncbi:MAG: hypothetical protein ABSE86_29390 [Bryobacteraceae bacterium]|jgi:hypothetical protein
MAQAKANQQGMTGKEGAGCALGCGGMAIAAVVIGWQAYVWLRTGHWPNLSLATAIAPIISGTYFWTWFVTPDAWLGLHTVIKFLFDLPLFLWIVAVAALAIRLLL